MRNMTIDNARQGSEQVKEIKVLVKNVSVVDLKDHGLNSSLPQTRNSCPLNLFRSRIIRLKLFDRCLRDKDRGGGERWWFNLSVALLVSHVDKVDNTRPT